MPTRFETVRVEKPPLYTAYAIFEVLLILCEMGTQIMTHDISRFRASDHPCSVVIKPTKGDFLVDYQNRNNLHIGVTNSKGLVIEYDSKV